MARETGNRPAQPTIDQLRDLPLQLSMSIPPEWEDRNGHVNVQFYVAIYELGSWTVLENEGIDEDWFERRDLSVFDLEHHLNYLAEVFVGDEIVAYNRLLDRSEKRFHGIYYIVNQTRGRLAATLEYITACVDMRTRRMTPFSGDLAGVLDKLLKDHRSLAWDSPVCGTMQP
jgi:acyl-CoA thioester hydrolase